MNDLYQRIYEVVQAIPPGKVATYGQIAQLAGNPRASRAVGWAMHGAPAELSVPCHRVVNQAGTLAHSGVFGGREVQRAMLESEGVEFLPGDRIDMRKCLWRPAQ